MAVSGLVRPLVATAAPMVVMAMNNMVMNNALPSIGVDFAADLDATKWVVTSYTFVFAALMLVAAKIGDRFGRRRIFRTGIVVFTLASVCCALAPTLPALIAARAAQAVGASAVLPLSLVLLTTAVPENRRDVAVGWWSGANGLAIALGPVVGGTVTGGAGWRWMFWLNVAVGLLSLVLSFSVLAAPVIAGERPGLDVPGMLGVVALIVLLMAAVSQAGSLSTHVMLVVAIAAGIMVVVPALVRWERRAGDPVLPVRLYRGRPLLVTYVVSLTMFFAIMGTTLLSSQYLQHTQGFSPLLAGLASLPSTAMPMIAAPLAGILLGRVGGARLMTMGLMLITAGLTWLAITTTVELDYFRWAPGMLMIGIGLGIEMTAANAIALASVPAADRGGATAMNNTVIELGGALGVSVLVAIFQGLLAHPDTAPPPTTAFVAAMRHTVGIGAAVAGIGALAAAFLTVRGDPTRTPRERARTRVVASRRG